MSWSGVERIGPYRVIGEVGRGGAGVVYRAHDPRLRRDVAIKMLRQARAGPAQVARFAREARALAKLRHPNIVTVYEVGQERGSPFIVMDFVEGETLGARLARGGPFAPRVAVAFITKAARAIDAAHRASVLHRDLKPDNLIVTSDGELLVTDFGLAKDLDDAEASASSSARGFLGTPGFAGPEQVRGGLEVGPAADVWGLGATLYTLITGSAPFGGASLVEIAVGTLGTPVEAPSRRRSGISPELDAICLRCLEKEPTRRFRTAGLLADALEAQLRGERGDPAETPAARRAFPVLGLVLAGLVVVLGATTVGLLAERSMPAPSPGPDLAEGGTVGHERPAERRAAPEKSPEAPPPQPPSEPARVGPPAPDETAILAPIDPLLEQAQAAFQRGDLTGSIRSLDRAIELAPSSARAWAHRGHAREWNSVARGLDRAELNRAIADYDRAIELDPAYAWAWAMRGRTRGRCADLEGSIVDLSRAIDLDPTDPVAWSCRATSRLVSGDPAGAISDLDRAIALDPTQVVAWTNRGSAKSRIADHEGALLDHRRAVELAPTHAAAWDALASTKRTMGDLTGAIADQDRALELDPGDDRILCNRAASKNAAGDFEGAAADADRAIGINPSRFLAWQLRGEARARLGDLEGALGDLNQAIARFPANFRAWFERGEVRRDLGDVAGAIADLEQAIRLGHPEGAKLRAEIARLRERPGSE